MDPLRGTGRTTRMLERVRAAMTAGIKCYVIVGNAHSREHALRLLKQMMPDHPRWPSGRIDGVDFLTSETEIRGIDTNARFFVDHYVFEIPVSATWARNCDYLVNRGVQFE